MRVQALYDFDGQPNTSEISIKEGEILTVTNFDVGEGWWEGKNSYGMQGIFPAAYVKEVSEPAFVPTQIPVAPPQIPQQSRYDQTADDDNDWDDDWEEDNDTYSEIGEVRPNTQSVNYANASLPPTPITDGDNMSITSNAKYVSKGGKRGDSFLMGLPMDEIPGAEQVYVLQMEHSIVWKPMMSAYTVIVDSPKKEKKFNGLKSFIAYQLTPSFNNAPVSRRYKHFDWLHLRLQEKFSMIGIPPLPEKQISNRYDDDFIEHRRVQLQEFVDWVCRHPILSASAVWMHFLMCTDEKKWKLGKRTAEKDAYQGITFCATVVCPERQLLPSNRDLKVEASSLFIPAMETSVKSLMLVSSDQIKKYQVQMKKDNQRIGEAFSELSRALQIDERREMTDFSLSSSVGKAAGIFIQLGQMFGDQPSHDFIPFSDRLHIYRGLLGSFPDVLNEHKNAIKKIEEVKKLNAEQKAPNEQLQTVHTRVEKVSYALLAEMSHFRAERDTHLRTAIKDFIGAQIVFYKNVVSKLEAAQSYF